MSPLEQKWRKRAAAGASYAVDQPTTRWAGVVSRPVAEASQPWAEKPSKIARRVKTIVR